MKAHIKVLALLLFLFFCGCSMDISNKSIESGIASCRPNGGLYEFQFYSLDINFAGTAVCNNGAKFEVPYESNL